MQDAQQTDNYGSQGCVCIKVGFFFLDYSLGVGSEHAPEKQGGGGGFAKASWQTDNVYCLEIKRRVVFQNHSSFFLLFFSQTYHHILPSILPATETLTKVH